jgi:AcrR family transcriptional regulator
MAILDRRKREKERLRLEILDAARELFVAEGYENVSMRKIAERIEYSPTTIYLYFKDKSELLQEICEASFEKLGDEIVKSQELGGTPLEILRRGMMAYIDFGLNNPHHYDVVFISPKEKYFNSDGYTFEGSAGQRAFELLAASVANCVQAGVIGQGNVAVIAQTLWAGIHGVTSLMITHEGFPFAERQTLTKAVVDTMIRGLRK